MSSPPSEVGWEFYRSDRATRRKSPVRFTATGNYSFDMGRDVTRSISGLTLLPEDRDELDLSSDLILANLILDGVSFHLGTFVFVEDVLQKGIVTDSRTGLAGDLTNVALADLSTLLQRNDGTPESIYAGFNPVNEMRRIITDAGVAGSISAGEAADTETVTWDGSTTSLSKLGQLAELAGHRNPWSDNYGVMRSVPSEAVFGDVLKFEEDIFLADSDSVTVSNNYLTVPNRVIVTSNSSAGSAIRGQWDAPASWPSSQSRRGYVRAATYEIQGVRSSPDAERVAMTIGRKLSARKLTAKIFPTSVLDGPRSISYGGALWTVTDWNMGTSPGSLLSFEAEEFFVEDETFSTSLSIPGVV